MLNCSTASAARSLIASTFGAVASLIDSTVGAAASFIEVAATFASPTPRFAALRAAATGLAAALDCDGDGLARPFALAFTSLRPLPLRVLGAPFRRDACHMLAFEQFLGFAFRTLSSL